MNSFDSSATLRGWKLIQPEKTGPVVIGELDK